MTLNWLWRKEIYQVDVDIIKETIEHCDEIICRVKKTVTIIDNKKIKNLFMMFIENKTEQL